ncbi:hypothetical protein [Kangiella koreensis]|uniref:Uncharacterized protein n=1 Tax=Kangiella koreensis (strain DSM 16069 / JCM 12317 / KCTC 12182 / SW-125) TaxID=523791 RepID=C7R7R3_KANKD|nr:hypothetical protein [Kangiella koreensis]ACV27596.1 hypothetical protein Kkor_2186 [Kangiella koreensis DSM 16069]
MKTLLTLLVIAISIQAYFIFELSQEIKNIDMHVHENISQYELTNTSASSAYKHAVGPPLVTRSQSTTQETKKEDVQHPVENTTAELITNEAEALGRLELSEKATDTFNQFLGLSESSSLEQIQEVSGKLRHLSREDYQAVMRKLIIESNKGNINFDIAFIH